MRKVLGLDLGPTSIGWAVLEEDDKQQPVRLIDGGVRIFNRVLEDKTPTPKNHRRRRARLLRRVIQRRARRRARMQNYLLLLGLLPKNITDVLHRESVLNALGDPYTLRKIALDRALAPHELGRIILHLTARRGFLSARELLAADMLEDPDVAEALQEEPDQANVTEEDETQTRAEINELATQIKESGARTLGEYLAGLPKNQRKRARRTSRAMYRDELQAIFDQQRKHHPVLTDETCAHIEDILFFQRPIRWSRDTIGDCEFEQHRRRAPMACLSFQRFRMLQDINHLRYDYLQVDEATGEISGHDIPLSSEDRQKLVGKLTYQQDMTWSAVRRTLGLPKTAEFNLEATTKKGLPGNRTSARMSSVLGDRWKTMSMAEQEELVNEILSFEKKRPLRDRLMRRWSFDQPTAGHLALLEFEPGHARLSRKAMNKTLPHLEQGRRYDEAIEAVYGHRQPKPKDATRLGIPPEVRNPVVQKALHEVRRLVNAAVAEFGHFDAIRVELPRELLMSKAQKERADKQNRKNQDDNEEAVKQYESVRSQNPQLKLPERPTFDDKLKYRLWKEQQEICAYSARTISMTALFTDTVEVDHVLPRAQSLDDSYMNKILCFASENRAKGNRTVREWLSSDRDRMEQIVQHARKYMPKPKAERFLMEHVELEGCINRMLTDTAYLSRLVCGYLSVLDTDVSVTKGQMTAWLRRQWALDPLLPDGKIAVKDRTDHRHHLVDAIVVALTTRRLYQQVAHVAASQRRIQIPLPFEALHDHTNTLLNQVIVVHEPLHKLTGALHEDTAYGVKDNGDGTLSVVYRKPLDALSFKSEKDLEKVLSPSLRHNLQQHLKKFSGNAKNAFAAGNRPILAEGMGEIRHVRIQAEKNLKEDRYLPVTDKAGRVFKRLPFGSNHHVDVLKQIGKDRYKGRFVTQWEAAQRVRREAKNGLIDPVAPEGYEYLFSLHINDLVHVTSASGSRSIYRVQKLDPTNQRMMLRSHLAATLDNASYELNKAVNVLTGQFQMRPLQVNILGRERHEPPDRRDQ